MSKRLLLIYAAVALVVTPTGTAYEAYRSPFRGDFDAIRPVSLPRQQEAAAKGDREPIGSRQSATGGYLASLFSRENWFGGKFTARAPASDGGRRNVPVEEVCETLVYSAQMFGLPVGFFARLIYQESSFRENLVSRAGAQGVAQFMPETAAEVGLADPFDPIASLPASAQYLRSQFRYFGNLGLAAAAYNAGAKRVEDWLARRSSLPSETRNYVIKITGHQPEKWLERKPLDLPMNLPAYAPCDGVAGLTRAGQISKIEARLEPQIAKIVDTAKAAAARAAERSRIGKAAKAIKAIKEAKARAAERAATQTARDKVDAKPLKTDKIATAER